MKETNKITQKLSYVYSKKDNKLFLKATINKDILGQVTYDKINVSSSDINSEVIYRKRPLTGITGTFSDTLKIKLSMEVPISGEVTVEKLKAIVRNYLHQHGYNAKFKLNTIFQESDGTVEESKITGISEDAEIDLTG